MCIIPCAEGAQALPQGIFLLLDCGEVRGVLREGLGKLRWREDV